MIRTFTIFTAVVFAGTVAPPGKGHGGVPVQIQIGWWMLEAAAAAALLW